MKHESEISQLLKSLKNIHSKDDKYGPDLWSDRFFSAIEKSLEPWKAHHRKSEVGRGEWLWDVVCLDSLIQDFSNLFLACEIEWSQKYYELLYDFKKLAVAKSDIKLFICQGCKEDDNQKLFSKLSDSIPDIYKSENETWILFITDKNENPFCWVWEYDEKHDLKIDTKHKGECTE